MAILDWAVRRLGPNQLTSRRQPEFAESPGISPVPAWVQQQFLSCNNPVIPLADTTAETHLIAAAIERWRQEYASSLAILGAFGTGKTTLLQRVQSTYAGLPLKAHRFTSRIVSETQLLHHLADLLGMPPPEDFNDLAARLQAGPRQAILLDDCHLLFLRRPGGFVALDLLLRFIRASAKHILWITTWNLYSWNYLVHVRSLADHFAKVHTMAPLSLNDLRNMLVSRLERMDFKVTWEADDAEAIFRSIWSYARGRPTLAQHIFVHSLRPNHQDSFELHADQVYRPPQHCFVKDGEDAYALGSLIRHGLLTSYIS